MAAHAVRPLFRATFWLLAVVIVATAPPRAAVLPDPAPAMRSWPAAPPAGFPPARLAVRVLLVGLLGLGLAADITRRRPWR